MRDALNTHEQKILAYLEAYIERWGRAPSYDEIGRAVNIPSKDHVARDLKRLQAKGYIHITPRIARGITLLTTADGHPFRRGVVRVPLYGTIAAGSPIPVPESVSTEALDVLELTRDIVGETRDIYALRVRGNSMVDALINDGDIVIMRHQSDVLDGEMAAVWLMDTGETTLKRVYREGRRVRLQPENKAMKPIWVDAEQVHIQGKVIAVIRQL